MIAVTETMKPLDVIIGVLSGAVLIVFGMVPGLFHGLMEALRNFENSLSSGWPTILSHRVTPWWSQRGTEYPLQRPIWMVGLGVAFIVLTLVAYYFY
jgi:hypothetical protein